jgi:N6-adenosine-specific RNA methylase IME4
VTRYHTLDEIPPHDVVLIDVPWSHYGSGTKMGAAAKEYRLMSDADVRVLPIRERLTDRGVLFVWATCPRLDFAIEVIKSWGLHYRGVGFVWVKTTKHGVPVKARGVRPSIVKPLVELVLCASPVRRGRPMKLASESVVQTVLATPTAHSAKPVEVYERIEALYPTATKLEVFARSSRVGWSRFGDQAPDDSSLRSIESDVPVS